LADDGITEAIVVQVEDVLNDLKTKASVKRSVWQQYKPT
jgi:hypothetical protein